MEITITYTLTDAEALAPAQRVKRMGFTDYLQNAANQDEVRAMMAADEKLRQALEEKGYAPR